MKFVKLFEYILRTISNFQVLSIKYSKYKILYNFIKFMNQSNEQSYYHSTFEYIIKIKQNKCQQIINLRKLEVKELKGPHGNQQTTQIIAKAISHSP